MASTTVGTFLSEARQSRRYAVVTDPRNELRGVASHTTFLVSSVKCTKKDGWKSFRVRRRFRDVLALHNSLSKRCSAALTLTAPEALVLGGALADPNAARRTMTKRRERQLSAYVENICEIPYLSEDAVARAFFELDNYSSWEDLRKQLGRVKPEIEVRCAAQAVERAGGTEVIDSTKRWIETLQSPSARSIAVEPVARFEAATDVELRARKIVTLARLAAQSAVNHAMHLRRLEDAWQSLYLSEKDAFKLLDPNDEVLNYFVF